MFLSFIFSLWRTRTDEFLNRSTAILNSVSTRDACNYGNLRQFWLFIFCLLYRASYDICFIVNYLTKHFQITTFLLHFVIVSYISVIRRNMRRYIILKAIEQFKSRRSAFSSQTINKTKKENRHLYFHKSNWQNANYTLRVLWLLSK